MYWVTAGEALLFDCAGTLAGRAKIGELLGAEDLFPPSDGAATWTWAAFDNDQDRGGGGQAEGQGSFRARTARVNSSFPDDLLVSAQLATLQLLCCNCTACLNSIERDPSCCKNLRKDIDLKLLLGSAQHPRSS